MEYSENMWCKRRILKRQKKSVDNNHLIVLFILPDDYDCAVLLRVKLFVGWFWGIVLYNCKTNFLQFRKTANMPIQEGRYDYSSWTIWATIFVYLFLWLLSLNFKETVIMVTISLVHYYFIVNWSHHRSDFHKCWTSAVVKDFNLL